jgi:FKBP-type peptidyl-prolyl cis-trans isomerase
MRARQPFRGLAFFVPLAERQRLPGPPCTRWPTHSEGSRMKYSLLAAAVALSVAAPHTFAQSVTEAQLKDEKTKSSYAIGLSMGRSLAQVKDEVDLKVIAKGIEDAVAGKGALTEEQMMETLNAFSSSITTRLATRNKEAGQKFLAENKGKAGVKTTASGLQYQVVTQGKGALPAATDQVKVHYRGTLLDGTEFDSSYKRNEPTQFGLNQVIKGWTEGLQLMPVGSKYKFFIPSDLAYGEQGPPSIGPNQALIFEVELLEIVKAAETAQ